MFSNIQTLRDQMIGSIDYAYSKNPRHPILKNIIDGNGEKLKFSLINDDGNTANVYQIERVYREPGTRDFVVNCILISGEEVSVPIDQLNSDVIFALNRITDSIVRPVAGYVSDEFVRF